MEVPFCQIMVGGGSPSTLQGRWMSSPRTACMLLWVSPNILGGTTITDQTLYKWYNLQGSNIPDWKEKGSIAISPGPHSVVCKSISTEIITFGNVHLEWYISKSFNSLKIKFSVMKMDEKLINSLNLKLPFLVLL